MCVSSLKTFTLQFHLNGTDPDELTDDDFVALRVLVVTPPTSGKLYVGGTSYLQNLRNCLLQTP